MQEKLQENTFLSLIKPSRCQPFHFPFLASHWHYENQLILLSLQELIIKKLGLVRLTNLSLDAKFWHIFQYSKFIVFPLTVLKSIIIIVYYEYE